MKTSFILFALLASASTRPGDSKVEPKLQQTLAPGETANIFVHFYQGTADVLKAITDTRFPDRYEKLKALGAALEENAEITQANAKRVLENFQSITPFSYTSLWITNEIYIRNATLQLISTLLMLPEISEMTEEQYIPLMEPTMEGAVFRRHQADSEWGIKKIQAEEATELLRNTTTKAGNQIVIATIDTGVRGTHEALRDNFFGQYGWFDPYQKTEEPNDQNGHGSHTTGTICGKGGIGVYPDALWMACKGCATNLCAQSALLECGQFLICPCLPDGSAKDCTKSPRVVSNSWGSGRSNTWFNGVIDAWQVAEIVPLFSIGNSGPSCNTANSPGDQLGVIGVGSTTSDDGISSFSSVGPTTDGRIKPDISAPGSSVISAYYTSDDAYASLSGTSMACPHAAGLVAILLAYDSELTFDGVQKLMVAGTETTPLDSNGTVCSDLGDDVFPNNVYGHGRINALHSLTNAISANGK